MLKSSKVILFVLSLTCSALTYAEVPIVEGYSSDQASDAATTTQQTKEHNTDELASTASGNSVLPLQQRVTILEQQVSNLTQVVTQVHQLESQIQDLRGDLETQKHTVKVLQDQLLSQYQDLDSRITVQDKNSAQSSTATKPSDTLVTKKNARDASTKSLNNNSSDLATAADGTNTNLTDNTSKTTNIDTTDKSTTPTSTATTDNNDAKAYQTALSYLKNKKYAQATTALQKFIKQYPTNLQVNNARFWLGQLYLLQGQPDKALDQFHSILKKDANNKKTPDILLQIGLAYYAKGDLSHADAAFKKLLQKYPSTAAAKLAQSRLKLIQQASVDQTAASADNDTSATA